MKNFNSLKLLFPLVAVTIVIMLFACTPASVLNTPSLSGVNLNGGYNLANNDLWDDGSDSFDKNLLNLLFSHLTGKPNAELNDVANLFKGNPVYTNLASGGSPGDPNGTWHQEYGSKVVKSNVLNLNANKISSGTLDVGLTVNLKNKTWRVTSLTLDDSGNIVATLLLKESIEKVIWNGTGTTEQPNMYGSSTVRNESLLGNNGFLQNFIDNDADFASNYLIKPKTIDYQKEQSLVTRWEKRNAYALVNEAYGEISGFRPGFDYYDDPAQHDKYTEWQNDYIWLPSLTEIGSVTWTHSIWGLPLTHVAHKNHWLRSCPSYNDKSKAYILDASAAQLEAPVNNENYLRPAMHLNLTNALALANQFSPNNPDDVETVYSGAEVELGEMDALPKWYNSNTFGDPAKIILTYYEDNNVTNPIGGVSDAGEYWVKATITPEWIAEGALKDAEVKFRDSADTGDPIHTESDTVRWFKWTVTPKRITVKYSSTSGKFDFQIKDNENLSAHYSGVIDGDDVALDFNYYSLSDPSDFTPIDNNSLDISALRAGKYALITDFKADGVDKDNYCIDSAEQTKEFVINAIKASITNVSWQYSPQGGTTVLVPSGEGGAEVSPFVLPYIGGGTYKFDIVTTALQELGVEIDITSYDNGYDNTQHSDVSGNIEEIKVRIVPLPDYAFYDADGSISVDQYREYVLFFRMGKTQIVKPTAGTQDLTYNGTLQRFNPQGFDSATMNISDNTAITADTYSAIIGLLDTINTEWSNGGGTDNFQLEWTIEQAKYDLSNVRWSAKELTYNGAPQSVHIDKASLPKGLSVQDTYITDNEEIVANKEGNLYYTANLIKLDNADEHNFVTPKRGDAGTYIGNFNWSHDWKILPQRITLDWDYETAEDVNGIEFLLPFAAGKPMQIEYEFYNSNSVQDMLEKLPDGLNGVVVDSNSVTYYWIKAFIGAVYTDNYVLYDNGADTNPLWFRVGEKKAPITLNVPTKQFTYSGSAVAVKFNSSVTALTADDFAVTYRNEQGQALQGAPANAGSYKMIIELKEEHELKYFISGVNNFTFTILPAELNLTGVEWVYNAAQPFVYGWSDDAAVEHKVVLRGLSAYLQGIVEYVNDGEYTNAATDAGFRTAKVVFNLTGDDANNYTFDPDEMTRLAELDWQILAKQFTKPPLTKSLVFDNKAHALAELGGLESGYEEYFNVSYKKNGDESFGSPTAKDAGIYTATFEFMAKHDANVEWDNGDTLPEKIVITIDKREVKINGWSGGKPPRPSIDASHADYYKIVYYNDDTIVTTPNEFDVVYRAVVQVVDGMGDNVIITAADGVELSATFVRFDTAVDPPKQVAAPPSFNIAIEYDGRLGGLTWEDFGGRAEDAEYIVLEGSPRMAVGNYLFKAHIDSTKNAEWADGRPVETVLEINVEVLKGRIIVNWGGNPPRLESKWDAYIDYIYTDRLGAVISNLQDFVNGTTYTAKAKIASQYADNYGFFVNGGYTTEVETAFVFADAIDVAKPSLSIDSIVYNGAEHTFTLRGFDARYMEQSGDNLTQKHADKYTVTISLKPGAKWDDGTKASFNLEFKITKKQIDRPTVGGSVTYNGGEQTISLTAFEGDWVTQGGVDKATYAGKYNAVFKLKDSVNTEWADGTTGDNITLEWEIVKLQIAKPIAASTAFTYNGAEQSIAEANSEYLSVSGHVGTDAGEYNAEFAIKESAMANVEWVGGGNENVVFKWSIIKAQIKGAWDDSDGIPTITGLPEGVPDSAVVYTFYDTDGKKVAKDKMVDGNDYTVKAELKEEYAKNYGFGVTASASVTSDEFALSGAIVDKLPLWQIIVTLIGLLLGLIFYGVAINNGAKTRQLKHEIEDKNKDISAYGMFPMIGVISGGETFLGMNNTAWTIIACAAAVFCLIGVAAILITGRQKNEAMSKLNRAERDERNNKESKERIEREDAARAERQQHETEMKMMFMMMMNKRGGANPSAEDDPIVYRDAVPITDVKEIVTQVVAALMPGMQAQLSPVSMAQYEKMESLVDRQMQVLDRQSKIIQDMKKEDVGDNCDDLKG